MTRLDLNVKISLIVSLLMILVVAGLGFFIHAYFVGQFKKTISDAQFTLVAETAFHLDDKIGLVQSQLVGVAERIGPEDLVSRVQAQEFIDDEKDTTLLFDNGLFLFSLSGQMLAGSDVEPQMWTWDYSARDFFRKTVVSGRPVISDPFLSIKVHQHPVVVFTAPVFDAAGKVMAVLAGSFDLKGNNFLAQLAGVKVGKEGYLYLVNTDRTLVVHPDPQRTGQRDVPIGANPLFDQAMADFEGTGETVTSRGLSVLVSFKRLQKVDWILAANYPLAEAHAPVNRAIQYAALATGAAICLSLALIWICMRYLTSPLRQLTGHIRQLAGRACDMTPLAVRRRDETGELAEAFNQLMARLCQADRELRKLTRAVEQSPSAIIITDTEGKIEYVNPAFSAATGYRSEEVRGENPRLLKSGEQSPEVYKELWETIRSGREWRGEFHNKRKDGTYYWADATIAPIADEEGRITHYVGEQENITERKRMEESLRESERFARATVDALAAHIAILDNSGTIVAVNRAWRDFADANPPVSGNVCEGANYLEVCAAAKGEGEEDARAFAAGIREVLAGTREKFTLEYPCHSPFERRWFVGRVTRFAGNGALRVVVAHEDITERMLSEEQILVMAHHDSLTGLPNRLLLQDRLQQALAHAGRNGQTVGVMYLDIDLFKQINDTLGHQIGDQVLKGFAGRLEGCVRRSDTVARMGGDEFVIVIAGIAEPEGVTKVARKIIERMQAPLRLPEREVPVSTSIGVALFPRDGEEGEALLKYADLALYEAKQQGRNQFRFYAKP
ncbi:MAG TPA: diguanylate cyclase [Desulfuromonadales bacterium]|nr:diguanylate cyclase [Desulfuromonadales bacterium]